VGSGAPGSGIWLAQPNPVVDVESAWVENEFIRLASPVEAAIGAGRFPPLPALVELAHAPHPVFARALPWRADSHPARRSVGFTLHTLRLYSPRAVTRLEWLLGPSGWLDCYDLEDGRLVLAASARLEEAEHCALELARASARIQQSDGRRAHAAELLVVGGPADPGSRLASLPTRSLTPDGPMRFTLSLVGAGHADRHLVALQPGAGVEETALHPATAARLAMSLSPGLELDCQDSDEGVYRYHPRAPHLGRLVVSDARGRVTRVDGRHGIHRDALRRSGDRALKMLGRVNGSGQVHRICVVLDSAIEVDLRDLVDSLESLVPVARGRGVERIDVVTQSGRAGGRILVGSLRDYTGSQAIRWRWTERQHLQSHGTRLRRS